MDPIETITIEHHDPRDDTKCNKCGLCSFISTNSQRCNACTDPFGICTICLEDVHNTPLTCSRCLNKQPELARCAALEEISKRAGPILGRFSVEPRYSLQFTMCMDRIQKSFARHKDEVRVVAELCSLVGEYSLYQTIDKVEKSGRGPLRSMPFRALIKCGDTHVLGDSDDITRINLAIGYINHETEHNGSGLEPIEMIKPKKQ
jgi:hypothetical protein